MKASLRLKEDNIWQSRYPLALPTSIGIANITLSANNAVAISQSPFTFQQQIVQHAGQRWTASVSIPPVRRDLAEPWDCIPIGP
jgi:hypothetical protein